MWEDNIREWTGLEFAKSQRAVRNREKWRKLAVKSSVERERERRGVIPNITQQSHLRTVALNKTNLITSKSGLEARIVVARDLVRNVIGAVVVVIVVSVWTAD